VVTRRNNEAVADFDNLIKKLATDKDRKIYTSTTGFVDRGKDFGSSSVGILKAPKIAVLFGEQTSSLSAGEIWHFFEEQLHYPITQIGTDYFRSVDLNKYDVLIVPEGRYRMFDEGTLDHVSLLGIGWRPVNCCSQCAYFFCREEGLCTKSITRMIPKKARLKRKIKKPARKMCWVAMKKLIANNYPMLSQVLSTK
jgi:hypothetical protein